MVHLITGYAGHGHVTSADDALYHAGVCGKDKYVMNTGTGFKATAESNNLITIGSGDLVDQGRHINIPTNSSESVTIENGTQGKTRIDVIAIRYQREVTTGIESANMIVLQGPSTNTGQKPEYPTMKIGNLYKGDDIDDIPLYAVTIEDIAIVSIDKMFDTIAPLCDTWKVIYPIGSIYMSASSTDPEELFGGKWEEIQGRFLLARDWKHQAGTTGGSENVTLTEAQIPLHTHSGPEHTHTVPSHTHSASTKSAGGHGHKVSRAKNAASGTARYAAQHSNANETHNTTSDGSHTHTVEVKGSGNIETKEAGTGKTGGTGGGKEHNNMPPYLAVFIWKRIE